MDTRRKEMKLKVQEVQEQVRLRHALAGSLDLVFVMDCTGSMDPWIAEAKVKITSIMNNVKSDHPNARVRVGFVAYRDFCDGANRLQTHSLTEDIASVRAFIGLLAAYGGGDGPEDIPGGIEAALKMDFRADAKRIVLVPDAPCHGSRFHNINMTDDTCYRKQIAASPDICAQMAEMKIRGIDITFIEIVPINTAKMMRILEAAYKSTENPSGSCWEFAIAPLPKASDVGRFGLVVDSSARTSISSSFERHIIASSRKVVSRREAGTTVMPTLQEDDEFNCEDVGHASPREIRPIPFPSHKDLDWGEVSRSPKMEAIRHTLQPRLAGRNGAVDWKKMQFEHQQQTTTIQLLPTYFAMGGMRTAHAMYDCNMEKRYLAKFYFEKTGGAAGAVYTRSVQDDVKTQIVAKHLADAFSKTGKVDQKVDFITACWYEIKHPSVGGLSPLMASFTAEPFIQGDYHKLNGNNGYVDRGLHLSDTAQAFSHFTWEYTDGQLMVVDLQGVGGMFTDPQIHSTDLGLFGLGNCSEAGMTAFFATHKCNDVCQRLKLLPLTRP